MSDPGHTLTARRAARVRALVQALLDGASQAERDASDKIEAVRPEHRRSAANLVHYVWLRGRDIRELQSELADLGLSALGRLESRVIPTLQALADALDQGATWWQGVPPHLYPIPRRQTRQEKAATGDACGEWPPSRPHTCTGKQARLLAWGNPPHQTPPPRLPGRR